MKYEANIIKLGDELLLEVSWKPSHDGLEAVADTLQKLTNKQTDLRQ